MILHVFASMYEYKTYTRLSITDHPLSLVTDSTTAIDNLKGRMLDRRQV
jgi:hypothetical protein